VFSVLNPHRLTFGVAYNFPFAHTIAVTTLPECCSPANGAQERAERLRSRWHCCLSGSVSPRSSRWCPRRRATISGACRRSFS
jgi:hypothetical protein